MIPKPLRPSFRQANKTRRIQNFRTRTAAHTADRNQGRHLVQCRAAFAEEVAASAACMIKRAFHIYQRPGSAGAARMRRSPSPTECLVRSLPALSTRKHSSPRRPACQTKSECFSPVLGALLRPGKVQEQTRRRHDTLPELLTAWSRQFQFLKSPASKRPVPSVM